MYYKVTNAYNLQSCRLLQLCDPPPHSCIYEILIQYLKCCKYYKYYKAASTCSIVSICNVVNTCNVVGIRYVATLEVLETLQVLNFCIKFITKIDDSLNLSLISSQNLSLNLVNHCIFHNILWQICHKNCQQIHPWIHRQMFR